MVRLIIFGLLFSTVVALSLPNRPNIIGGEETKPGEINYQIILLYRNYNFCGATLIEVNGTQFVLTAAHCVEFETPNEYKVIGGDWKKSEISGSEQTRQVSSITIHEEYNGWTNIYDIAILGLEKPFELNEFIQPIPLPYQGQQTPGNVLITGWGWTTADGSEGHADILHKVEMPTVSQRDCALAHGEDFTPTIMFCSGVLGVGGKDSCFGDSGGPVKAVDGGYLAGIVSWGALEGCALPQFPGVNANVSHFVNWIEAKTPAMLMS